MQAGTPEQKTVQGTGLSRPVAKDLRKHDAGDVPFEIGHGLARAVAPHSRSGTRSRARYAPERDACVAPPQAQPRRPCMEAAPAVTSFPWRDFHKRGRPCGVPCPDRAGRGRATTRVAPTRPVPNHPRSPAQATHAFVPCKCVGSEAATPSRIPGAAIRVESGSIPVHSEGSTLRFGFVMPVGDARQVMAAAAPAEAHGWDGFFVSGPVWGVDAWVSMTAAALATSSIRIGTLLSPLAGAIRGRCSGTRTRPSQERSAAVGVGP